MSSIKVVDINNEEAKQEEEWRWISQSHGSEMGNYDFVGGGQMASSSPLGILVKIPTKIMDTYNIATLGIWANYYNS